MTTEVMRNKREFNTRTNELYKQGYLVGRETRRKREYFRWTFVGRISVILERGWIKRTREE